MLVWFQFVVLAILQIPEGQLSLHTFIHAELEMCSELRCPDVGLCVPFIKLFCTPSTAFVTVLKDDYLFLFNGLRTLGISYSMGAVTVVGDKKDHQYNSQKCVHVGYICHVFVLCCIVKQCPYSWQFLQRLVLLMNGCTLVSDRSPGM